MGASHPIESLDSAERAVSYRALPRPLPPLTYPIRYTIPIRYILQYLSIFYIWQNIVECGFYGSCSWLRNYCWCGGITLQLVSSLCVRRVSPGGLSTHAKLFCRPIVGHSPQSSQCRLLRRGPSVVHGMKVLDPVAIPILTYPLGNVVP